MPTIKTPPPQTDNDPLWYKKAVIYQAHVRSFCDSDANGIGDFRGLTSKLDYLQDLGVTAIPGREIATTSYSGYKKASSFKKR